ncbi:hypothetical protein [Nocardioides caldifontis]|uniref:hypothetical protein n=1 Tax=Nocardioides caldifontis TaxID=2588938 RepID=UPI0011E00D76|nr:hypothetical protein [Nocardioides caldifontis]
MAALQTVAMGLVLVFLDVQPSGWDWVPDPLGWVLVLLGLSGLKELLPNHRGTTVTAWLCLLVDVLIWPPGSVAEVDDSLGWLFSVPTLAFCFLVCDALTDLSDSGRQALFRWLRNLYVVVAVLPLLVHWVGWEWLELPSAALAVGCNVVLVVALWSAGDEDEEDDDDPLTRIRRRTAPDD